MTARSFTVETRAQAALIVGGMPELTNLLTKEFKALGLHTASVTTAAEIARVAEDYDPDYLVVFPDAARGTLSTLESLVQSGQSRLTYIHHVADRTPVPLAGPLAHELLFSDYVGENELYSPSLETWLSSVMSTHTLRIPGDGLQEISLLGENDLARGLVLATIHPGAGGGDRVFLGNPETISLSSLAYNIRSELPFKVSVTFSEEEGGPEAYDPKEALTAQTHLDWELSDNVLHLLQKYVAKHLLPAIREEKKEPIARPQLVPEVPQVTVAKPDIIPATPVRKLTPLKMQTPVFIPLAPRRRLVLPKVKIHFPKLDFSPHKKNAPPSLKSIIGKGIGIALALYLGSLAFALTLSLLSVRDIANSLKNGSIPVSNKFTNLAGTYLEANWVAMTSLPGLSQNSWLQSGAMLLDSYNQALRVFATARELSLTTGDLTRYILGNGQSDIASTLSQSRLEVEVLYQELSLLAGSLPADKPAIIPARYAAYYQAGRTKLGKLQESVITTKAMLAALPDLIGLGGRKKYGVLFQNNMELRATGGFIGSFAILSFENGKLYDMPVYDVYAADGQLKGHVEPPKPIKDILGEANWYLRDSNFDPDFPTSARRAEWFIKKTLNLDLDGTIAVDVDSLKDLLAAVGPLQIPDYNETITADNLYERTQSHAEVNFFPGSTQKKEFLSTVGNALFAKLPTLGAGDGLKLITALTKSIEEKNTLISLATPAADRVFSTLNWNGQIDDLPCPLSPSCQKDYAMVVDSNFGVNKANYFLKRGITETITINKDMSVDHVLDLKYTNNSTSNSWPAGEYKNYQRIYLPPNAIINGVKVGNSDLSTKDYTVTTEHNKLVVSYLATVPINDSLEITITYQLSAGTQGATPVYTWYWQKQPGTSADDALSVTLNYPMYLKPQVISPVGKLGSQQLKFNLSNDTDHRVTVQFTQ